MWSRVWTISETAFSRHFFLNNYYETFKILQETNQQTPVNLISLPRNRNSSDNILLWILTRINTRSCNNNRININHQINIMKVSSNPLVQRIEKHAKGISNTLEQLRNAKFDSISENADLIADEYVKDGKKPWMTDFYGIKFHIDQCKETKATLINYMGAGFRKVARTNEDIKSHIRHTLWEASRQMNLQIYRKIADSNI